MQLIKPDKGPVAAAGQQGSASAGSMSGLSSDTGLERSEN